MSIDTTPTALDIDRLKLSNSLGKLSDAFALEAGRWHALAIHTELSNNAHTLDQHARAALGSMPLDILDAYVEGAENLLRNVTGARKLIEHITKG